jgi:hypothetical protein
LGIAVTEEFYGVKVSTIVNAGEKLTADLDYLCSLVEQADPEFLITSAVIYAEAVMALSNQLEFLIDDLTQNDLSEDEIYVKLSEEELQMLNMYTANTDAAIERLEEVCGISLQNN